MSHLYRTLNPGGTPRRKPARNSRGQTLAQQIRATNQWHIFSVAFRLKRKWCCDPWRIHERVRQATSVHHVIGIEQRPDLAFNESNCRSLCASCHNRVEARERERAGSTACLFIGTLVSL